MRLLGNRSEIAKEIISKCGLNIKIFDDVIEAV
jgi:succinyl-CoA synthetase beta subunit